MAFLHQGPLDSTSLPLIFVQGELKSRGLCINYILNSDDEKQTTKSQVEKTFHVSKQHVMPT